MMRRTFTMPRCVGVAADMLKNSLYTYSTENQGASKKARTVLHQKAEIGLRALAEVEQGPCLRISGLRHLCSTVLTT